MPARDFLAGRAVAAGSVTWHDRARAGPRPTTCCARSAPGEMDLARRWRGERTRLPDERDRALAGEIATGTLRWQGAFDHVIATFAGRPLAQA